MSKDKPIKWILFVVAIFVSILLQLGFNVWDIDFEGEEILRPLMIFLPQLIAMVLIIIYKFRE